MFINPVQKPSPNVTKTRYWQKPDKVVIHWIAGTLADADAVFANKTGRRVSAHYAVGGDGTVHQYVDEAHTAWHAGDWWTNVRSIGIELEGSPSLPISELAYDSCARLLSDIWHRNPNIKVESSCLRRHNEFRKTQCPGNADLEKIFRLAVSYHFGHVESPTPSEFPKVVVAKYNCKRRAQATTQSDEVGTYKKGEQIEVIGVTEGETITINGVTSNLWYNNGYGYISKTVVEG